MVGPLNATTDHVNYVDSNTGLPVPVTPSTGLPVSQATVLAGEKIPSSQTDSYIDSRTGVLWKRLHSTAALNVQAGAFVGTSPFNAGVAGDTHFLGCKILANGTPVTLTVTGMADETGSAASDVYTGSASADTYFGLNGLALVNDFAAMTLQASVADKVWVALRRAG
jgi:hypothetical protein